MNAVPTDPVWVRRARPMLGTLVEIGIRAVGARDDDQRSAASDMLIAAAFDRVRRVQDCLSRFDAGSDIARFNAMQHGEYFDVQADTEAVLNAAADLRQRSDGCFDISLGTAPTGWINVGRRLRKTHVDARIDLGGIGKGYAVDCAVLSLVDQGCVAGWVNAGGDLRCFGDVELPIHLRDEGQGGVRSFASLCDGAFATSVFGANSASQLAPPVNGTRHASVAAPLCLWADALTKIVAASGDASHPVLAHYRAVAWLH